MSRKELFDDSAESKRRKTFQGTGRFRSPAEGGGLTGGGLTRRFSSPAKGGGLSGEGLTGHLTSPTKGKAAPFRFPKADQLWRNLPEAEKHQFLLVVLRGKEEAAIQALGEAATELTNKLDAPGLQGSARRLQVAPPLRAFLGRFQQVTDSLDEAQMATPAAKALVRDLKQMGRDLSTDRVINGLLDEVEGKSREQGLLTEVGKMAVAVAVFATLGGAGAVLTAPQLSIPTFGAVVGTGTATAVAIERGTNGLDRFTMLRLAELRRNQLDQIHNIGYHLSTTSEVLDQRARPTLLSRLLSAWERDQEVDPGTWRLGRTKGIKITGPKL